ncbi:MAG: efflux RND transporter permease subunit [Hydrogenibacillus sp.]|nr:efflux RND transporter permease subunit [Hydrogenibacillus sp.]
MSIIDFSIRRPVFITMVIIGMMLIGLFFLPSLPVELLPKMNLPVAVVVTSYSGAAPEEIENRITKPIENAVGTVNRVSKIESQSQMGASLVIVQFDWGTNMDKAQIDLQRQIDRLANFLPDDADKPLVLTIDPTEQPIMLIGVSGDKPLEELQKIAEDTVEPTLRKVDGVGSVSIAGGEKEEVQVILNPDRLNLYGLTPAYLAQSLAQSNFLATAGALEQGDKELAVRFDAELTGIDDVKRVQIPLPSGGTVALADVAEVRRGFAQRSQSATLNGHPFVLLSVMQTSGGNAVQTSNGVHQALQTLERKLPEGTSLTVIFDSATFIKQSMRNVVEHGALGGLIAMIILYLFLGNLRTTLIVGVMLPVSVIATFTLMALTDQSINLLTLGGLLIGMGSLVDFAIVVIESIHRHRLQRKSPEQAATVGAKEVTAAVTASALAQTSVFVPMLVAAGLAKELFGPMALAVIFSHVAAWFGAITFVPMLAARMLPRYGGEADDGQETRTARRRFRPVRAFQRAIEGLERLYRRLLGWGLAHRLIVIALSFVIFIASFALLPLIGSEFIPESDQGVATISVELPPSTKLEETARVVRELEGMLLDYPEVKEVASMIGSTGESQVTGTTASNSASITVNMKPQNERRRTTQEVMNDFSARAEAIPGVIISANTQMSVSGATGVQVNISGPNNQVLEAVAGEVADLLASIPGVASVESSMKAARPEAAVYIDRARAARYGLSPMEIQTAIQTAFGGKRVTIVRDGKDEYDVRLMFPEGWEKDLAHLSSLVLRSSSGALVSLGDVARVVTEGTPTAISRSDGERQARLTVYSTGERSLGALLSDVQATLGRLPFPEGYAWSLGGEAEQMAESFGSLTQAMALAILLIYMIMAAQFESFFQPFVIMFSLPPTFVGAFLGLFVHRMPLSVTAFIGLIMVIGLVMNNAIVLVDYTNQLRRRGMSARDALLTAGPVRLRPILMTMLATNLVLVPFAYFGGEASEMLAPLAVVVIYGLLFSTLVTLLLIPAVYSFFDDFFARLRRWFRREHRTAADASGTVSGG